AQGKDAHMLALVEPAVIEAPELRPLMARVPFAKGIAEGEDALFCARFLFITPGAADAAIEAEFLDCIEQGHCLHRIAALIGVLDAHAAAIDRILHGAD